jgi:hypothetical protein
MKYPSEWFGGKFIGSIREVGNNFQVNIRNEKKYYKSFPFNEKNKKEIYNDAIKYRNNISDEICATINKIRYIDSKTIEVKLTQNQILITDALFIDIVEKYKLQAKKTRQYYYAVYQEKKKVKRFIELISDINDVEYINGNRLDNRLSNLKEKGSIDNNLIKQNNEEYDYLSFKYKYDKLPLNIWILGKPVGTIFKRNGENIWTVNIKDENGKNHVKTFNIKYYDNEIDAYIDALEWQYKSSNELGLTKNRIRLIDDNTMEVELTKEQIMTTDKKFIDLVESIPLFSYKSSGINQKYYAGCMNDNIQTTFHNLITGYKMVDHIDRNPLNNKLSNLLDTTYKLNNNNQTIKHNNTSGCTGVRLIDNSKGNYWEARIKQNDKQYSKCFSIKKYGYDKAKELAIKYRKYLNDKFESTNGEDLKGNLILKNT